MKNKFAELFIEWCDALVAAQITDEGAPCFGGFRCDSCDFVHGRADNAVYPLVYAHVLTGADKYLAAAERLLTFREKLTEETGAVHNDFSSEWRGITSFSAINLLKTTLYFGDAIPASLRERIEAAAKSAAHWVHENMIVGFRANVNYYAAASLVNALYGDAYGDEEYTARARELLSYCLSLFTENGFLSGEGQPHGVASPRGCLPIDVGYIVEESLPCLVHTATILGDETALDRLTENARKLLDFFLPDGGWDNSFGVRNNKWTYYGSRTSDGCIGAFTELAARDPLFSEAAERTYEVLRKCTQGGKLYGGMQYFENEQPACIHHTFCHAGALADALHAGIAEGTRRALPCDAVDTGYKYYPEIDTYKIRAGRYLATVTGYDYATYTYGNGAAHAGGGTLSLLYKQGAGVMIAGSVYEYRRTEKNNMQFPAGERRHATLLPRAEYLKDGRKYATCLDKAPEISVSREGDAIVARVRARFFSAETEATEDEALHADFVYRFTPQGVTLTVGKLYDGVSFILPVITGEVRTENAHRAEPIFFLTGGFAADEYTFSLAEDVSVTLV